MNNTEDYTKYEGWYVKMAGNCIMKVVAITEDGNSWAMKVVDGSLSSEFDRWKFLEKYYLFDGKPNAFQIASMFIDPAVYQFDRDLKELLDE